MLPTRLVVVSDLHLGGSHLPMMSRPPELDAFIHGLRGGLKTDERLELVIAGDFVDFLACTPFAPWTPEPLDAVRKLRGVMKGFHAPVFDALAAHVQAGHQLTVLVGNHDLELGLPQVQDALSERLGGKPGALQFVDDGRAYRLGRVLVEHGHRYDEANQADQDGLRAIRSTLSRREHPAKDLHVSAGSQLVCEVVNPLKQKGYTFIDLLQPQGELLLYLLVAMEPALKYDIDLIRKAAINVA